ncbi:MAG: CinA family protein, partial [Cyclobacteriaceae bacterium]|nr:CinA family protein [Cyclobacteriaceae bacterium]
AELGVRAEDIEKYGAVSEEVVIQMAEGVRNRLKSEVGVAISGVAGPGGGSPEKPVGTVWLACSVNGKVKTKLLSLGDRGRLLTIKVAGLAALNLIRITLIQSR